MSLCEECVTFSVLGFRLAKDVIYYFRWYEITLFMEDAQRWLRGDIVTPYY